MKNQTHKISLRDWYALVATDLELSIAKSLDNSLTESDCRYIVADSKIAL